MHRDRRGVDSDGLTDAAYFEHGVDSDVAAALHENILLDKLAEPWRLHGEGIISGQHEIEQVLPGGGTVLQSLNASVVVAKDDLGSDDDGLSGVLNHSLDFGPRVLRVDSAGR